MDLAFLTELFEALTIFCFGLSWPVSIYKSYRSRTAKGKSLTFEIFLLIGYAFGIARKAIQCACGLATVDWIFILSFAFYCLNCVEILIDSSLYMRNKRLDRARAAQRQE